jgi:hypothetical protein
VPPVPPNASAIATYLKTPQNSVLTFERGSKVLNSGSVPSKSACQETTKSLAGTSGASPGAVSAAIKGIPNTAIQVAVSQDLQAKLILLSNCSKGTATEAQAASVHATSAAVQQEFQQLGISL